MTNHTTTQAQRDQFVTEMTQRMATLARTLSDWVMSVYYPFDATIHYNVAHYQLMTMQIYNRDRSAYVATWHAVQTLKRRGIVRSVIVNVGPEFVDFLPANERRWIKIALAAELCLPNTTHLGSGA